MNDYLPAGTYTFVCGTFGDYNFGNDETIYLLYKGKNPRLSKITKTIKPTDKDCYLSFILQHKAGQAKIVVKSEAGDFSGLTAKLMSSGAGLNNCPSEQVINLPDVTYGSYTTFTTLDEEVCSNAAGTEATHAKPIYLLGGEGYDYSANCGAEVEFSAGSINGTSLAGKSVALNNFVIQSRVISKATVTFKKNPAITVNFNAGEGGTVTPTTFTGKTGDVVTAMAMPNTLGAFEGWYNGTTLITSDANTTISGNKISLKLTSEMNGLTITGKFSRPQTLIPISAYRHYPPVNNDLTYETLCVMIANGIYFDHDGPEFINSQGGTTRSGFWLKCRNLNYANSSHFISDPWQATPQIRQGPDYNYFPCAGTINTDDKKLRDWGTAGVYQTTHKMLPVENAPWITDHTVAILEVTEQYANVIKARSTIGEPQLLPRWTTLAPLMTTHGPVLQ